MPRTGFVVRREWWVKAAEKGHENAMACVQVLDAEKRAKKIYFFDLYTVHTFMYPGMLYVIDKLLICF